MVRENESPAQCAGAVPNCRRKVQPHASRRGWSAEEQQHVASHVHGHLFCMGYLFETERLHVFRNSSSSSTALHHLNIRRHDTAVRRGSVIFYISMREQRTLRLRLCAVLYSTTPE